MEAFSLLKYWRGSGGANVRSTAATVLRSSATESSSSSSDEDEGSFFDLEFSANHNEGGTAVEHSSGDDLFFKGQLLPLDVEEEESPSIAISADIINKAPHFSASLLESVTRFRIFMLGLKKPKPTSDQNHNAAAASASAAAALASPNHNKFFVKFNVEDVPIVSLFARETRSRKDTKAKKAAQDQEEEEEKKLNASSRETVQKYMVSKIKPLYVRVSKRYGEKLRFSGLLSEDGAAVRSPLAGMTMVRKKLGKSKSAVAAVVSPPVVSQRRDDSLLQQQDGIQSAIAHCKRTLNPAKVIQSPVNWSKSDPTDDRSENGNVVL